MAAETFILGAGITGLAAAYVSGLPVFEAEPSPGGICCSYYVRPGETARLRHAPSDGEVYRFEVGGGHWIFGGDATVLRFIRELTPVRSYLRKSSVYFHRDRRYVPFPLQNHLRFLPSVVAQAALREMVLPKVPFRTMREWLLVNFGPTLCELFFFPFHALYTADYYDEITPQDAYKSPVDLSQVIKGAFAQSEAVGYNTAFVYPTDGLNRLASRMAERCDIRYEKRVVHLDARARLIGFADGTSARYAALISTLPLNRVMDLVGLAVEATPDPHTSVLVLNIGAVRGETCPGDHWLYNPDASSGFHRVGYYSNVDPGFLPRSAWERRDRVSIYVERAYQGGSRPTANEVEAYAAAVVRELQTWGHIGTAEVVDPTWIDVAYTWSWPGSRWISKALRLLEEHGIYQVGRYARWSFQGIADSIRDGFIAGGAFKARFG